MDKHAEEVFNQAIKIVKAICKHRNIDNSYIPIGDIEDSIPCPCCDKGIMTYTISSHNGDRSAQCSENCFGYYCE